MTKFQLFAAALCAAIAAPVHAAPPLPPAQVAIPDAQRLALAARISDALWPNGTYGRILEDMMGGENGLIDMALDMRPADLLGATDEGPGKNDKAAAAADSTPSPTVREAMRGQDPDFEERMRITAKVVGEEMTRLAAPIEPKMRDGLTKSIARRFSRDQLGPIADFFGTDAGKAYAAQSVSLFIDKDVILALISSIPPLIKEVPGVMEKVKKATAHLPPPPKHESAESGDGSDNDSDSGDEIDQMPPS